MKRFIAIAIGVLALTTATAAVSRARKVMAK